MMVDSVKWIVIMILSLVLQGTVVQAITIFGARPDFPLVALFFLSIIYGSVPGILAGFCLGLCQDLYAPSILGLNALAATVCGCFAGLFNDRVMRTDPLIKGVLLIVAFLVHDVIALLIVLVKSGGVWTDLIAGLALETLPRALYSMVFVALYYVWSVYFKPSGRR